MATGYGNFVSGSGYGWRVQVVVNVASETATQITYNVYGQFYNEHRILSYANGSVSGGGQSRSWDDSTRNLNGGNPGTTNFASYSVTLNKGSSARTETFSARFQVTGGYGNGTSNASVGVQVPAITYSAPNAPSNCSATRVSDTQATVTWSNGSTSTTQPRTAVLVERQADSGSWVQVASLSASATNYTDNNVSADHRYAYRVRSQGNGGTSGYSTSGYIYTTPAAPSSVTAAKDSASSVTLSAEGLPAWAEGYEISRTADGGGSWQAVGTADTFPWTDASAPAGTIRYRVRSYRGELYSAYVESNSITTITPPLAPTVQQLPSVIAVGSSFVISWTPNHPDGSAQEQAQIGYVIDSGSEQYISVSGSATSYTVPSSMVTAPTTVQIRVRTHGLDDEWGAWSAAQTVRVAVPPSASITVPPVDGARVGSLPLAVEWDASDATGVSSQSIALLDSAGSTLYSASLGASERELVLDESTYLLANATDYSLRLTVRGGSSLTTTVARSFSTSFAGPARPDAVLSVDPSDLSAAVTVYAGNPSSETGEVIEVPAAPGTLVPGFTVFGNTRQNLWVNPVGSVGGATVTRNDDGTVTLSGTPTADMYFSYGSKVNYVLKPGGTYTLSIDKALPTGCIVYVTPTKDKVPVSGSSISISSTLQSTDTLPDDFDYVVYQFYFIANQALSGTYRIMLNEGTEPEPWCPPGLNGVEELSVVCAGKNLLARLGPELPYTNAGITFSDNGDGGIRISGTATVTAFYNFFDSIARKAPYITPGEYTASLTGQSNGVTLSVGYFYDEVNGDYTRWLATSGSSLPSTDSIDRPAYLRAYIGVPSGATVDIVVYPQLERGSIATVYDPPSITTTPIDLDGHTLNGLPDGTRDELRIDGTGAVTLVQRVGSVGITTDTEWNVYDGNQNILYANLLEPHAHTGDVSGEVDHGMMCDSFPCMQKNWDTTAVYSVGMSDDASYKKALFFSGPDVNSISINGTVTVLYPLANPQEIDLPGVAMPAFPAAETQVFCASNIPCEVRVDYPETESFTVQRALPDGSRHTIATGLTEGQQALDRLPPLNVDYTYLVTAYAETGVSSTQELPAHVDSGGMEAFNFGVDAGVSIVLGYNATGSERTQHTGEEYRFALGLDTPQLPTFYADGELDVSGSHSYVAYYDDYERIRSVTRGRQNAVFWFRNALGSRSRCFGTWSTSYNAQSYRLLDVSVDITECVWEDPQNG